MGSRRIEWQIVVVLALLLAACGDSAEQPPPPATASASFRDPLPTAVPPLPFADNADPSQCGIPVQWGGTTEARVTGVWQGQLVQPLVYLYDSHLRNEVVGQVPDGGRVVIELSQSNPTLDYYRVRSLDLDPPQSGWLPAPFLVRGAGG